MEQQFLLGQKLSRHYVDEMRFLNRTYSSFEVNDTAEENEGIVITNMFIQIYLKKLFLSSNRCFLKCFSRYIICFWQGICNDEICFSVRSMFGVRTSIVRWSALRRTWSDFIEAMTPMCLWRVALKMRYPPREPATTLLKGHTRR